MCFSAHPSTVETLAVITCFLIATKVGNASRHRRSEMEILYLCTYTSFKIIGFPEGRRKVKGLIGLFEVGPFWTNSKKKLCHAILC